MYVPGRERLAQWADWAEKTKIRSGRGSGREGVGALLATTWSAAKISGATGHEIDSSVYG